jgi:hypothetical protein
MKSSQSRVQIANVTQLAQHFDCSREQISRLEKQGVIERLPDGGFDLDASRVKYLRHLRERRPTGDHRKSFEQSRAAREKLKLMRESREVCYVHEFAEFVDAVGAAHFKHYGPVASRIGGTDLALRRRAEQELRTAQQGLSDEMKRLGSELAGGNKGGDIKDGAGDMDGAAP